MNLDIMGVYYRYQPGADLEKYFLGGERGAGIFEGWQHMSDVYLLNLISYHSLMRNSMYTLQKGTGCHLQTHTDKLHLMQSMSCIWGFI